MAQNNSLVLYAFAGGIVVLVGMGVVLLQVVNAAADGDDSSYIAKMFGVGASKKNANPLEEDWRYYEQQKAKRAGDEAAGVYQKPPEPGVFDVDVSARTVAAGLAGLALAGAGLVLVVRLGKAPPPPPRATTPGSPSRVTSPGQAKAAADGAAVAGGDNLGLLRARDPGFSRPVMMAFLQNLQRSANHAATVHDWSDLRTWISDEARLQLERGTVDVREFGETVLERVSAQIVAVEPAQVLRAEFTGFREERGLDGRLRILRFHETWTMERNDGSVSAAPDQLVALACPACSAVPGVTSDDGRCATCGQPVAGTGITWYTTIIEQHPRRSVDTIQREAHLTAHGAPLVRAGDVHGQMAALQANVPGFDGAALMQRCIDLFYVVQGACRNGEWRATRPWCTDIAYEQVRYANEAYEMADQVHVRDEIELERIEIVRVDDDPFYTSVTVRLWWHGKDYVMDATGQVVEGNPRGTVADSACWTFQRAHGHGAVGPAITECPSCGSSIDRVDGTGTCQACQSWLCDGQFSWVLARIDSVAAFNGT